ncbi:uncharacterized protein [Clytia hemisphaerica]|uniref:RNA-dependent RNA polymerase n=1 Tax=Clytia hemisphaerica TaxID=252671 RepID=A0A7M5UQ26_9CNID
MELRDMTSLRQRRLKDWSTRENVFELLEDSFLAEVKEEYRIPATLVNDESEDFENPKSIITFEYDIQNKCFKFKGYQTRRSIFFKQMFQTLDRSQFMIVQFSEKTFDESVLNRDRYIESVLRKGVRFKGQEYNILGCSNSQVQKKSFVFMQRSKEQCKTEIKKFIPQLHNIELVAKRVKYAGLLFTPCQYMLHLPTSYEVCEGENYERGRYDFADGCGTISFKLAKEIIVLNEKLQMDWGEEIPSVWQIRYCGRVGNKSNYLCKGVLVVDFNDQTRSVITLRSSMMKIVANDQGNNFLGIVETSCRPKFGKVNKQFITLTSHLVKDEDWMAIQRDYLTSITKCRHDASEAFRCSILNRKESTFKILLRKYGFKYVIPSAYTNLIQNVEGSFIQSLRKDKRDIKDRIQIPLASSRLVFGAVIPKYLNQYLEEGQCIMLTEKGAHIGNVIVSRSPSYSPGDIQILEAVRPPKGFPKEMKNVILFSTQGVRPVADKMSGGDLDGDMYLVVWHENLLQYVDVIKKEKPMIFDDASSTVVRSDKHWITYVAHWDNTILGQIDSCFYEVAEEFGVNSSECQELCKIFSRAVDNVQDDLKRLKEISNRCFKRKSERNRSQLNLPIWEKMSHQALTVLENLREKRNGYPILDDWAKFSDSLVYTSREDLDKLFSSPRILAVGDDIDVYQKNWVKILQQRPKEVVMETIINCTFDCKEKTCQKEHSKDPTYYKVQWLKRLHGELGEFVQTFRDEQKAIEEQLEQHERLREEISKEEEKNEADFQAKVEKHIDVLDNLMQHDQLIKGSVAQLKHQIKELENGFSEYESWFCKNSRRDELKNEILIIIDQLFLLYKKITMELNEVAMLFNTKGTLVISFQGSLDHYYVSQRFILTSKEILEEAKQCWLKSYPLRSIQPISMENIETLLAVTYREFEEGIERLTELHQTREKVKEELHRLQAKEHEMKKMEKTEMTNAIKLANMLNMREQSVMVEGLRDETLWSPGSKHTRESLVNVFLGTGEREEKDDCFKELQRLIENDRKHKESLVEHLKGERVRFCHDKDIEKYNLYEIEYKITKETEKCEVHQKK